MISIELSKLNKTSQVRVELTNQRFRKNLYFRNFPYNWAIRCCLISRFGVHRQFRVGFDYLASVEFTA